jgi:hypothetical protein
MTANPSYLQYGTQTVFCGNMTKALRNHKVRFLQECDASVWYVMYVCVVYVHSCIVHVWVHACAFACVCVPVCMYVFLCVCMT